MPAKSRLDATKVLVNVFDLDVSTLSPDQQFQLAQKTFEKREKDSRRKFFLLASGGVFFLLFAAGYSLANLDGAAMIKTALTVDEERASRALNDKGFFEISDTQFDDTLASKAVVDRTIDDPFERTDRFLLSLREQPAIQALRERAQEDRAPFEQTGEIMEISVPNRPDQPSRYQVYVRRKSPLAGRAITIRARGRPQYLRLYAYGAIDFDATTDMQLNYEQCKEIFGDKPRESGRGLVTPSSDSTVFDPTCPKYQGFKITTCDLDSKINVSAIPT